MLPFVKKGIRAAIRPTGFDIHRRSDGSSFGGHAVQLFPSRPRPSIEDVSWTDKFPFALDSEAPCVLDGDWDLARVQEFCPPATGKPCLLPVAIGRDGDLIADQSANYTVDAGRVSVAVVGRHAIWNTFRRQIFAYTEHEGARSYAPLTHADFWEIPFWTGRERSELIKANVHGPRATILDIGAYWGFMCEELEKAGHRCTAVEADETRYRFMLRLRRAQRLSYRAIFGDICDVIRTENTFDVVLAFAVFHHFIKTKRGHAKLVDLLQQIETKQLFFWAHNTAEKQMIGAYRNYEGDEFAELIVKHTGLVRYRLLAVVEGRRFYEIS